MYHDEFAKRTARALPGDDIAVPAFALEFGGGLSMGLAASLNPAISALFFSMGGLLPLVASSFAIAFDRAARSLGDKLAPLAEIVRRPAAPAPHLIALRSTSDSGPHLRSIAGRPARGRLDHSRQAQTR